MPAPHHRAVARACFPLAALALLGATACRSGTRPFTPPVIVPSAATTTAAADSATRPSIAHGAVVERRFWSQALGTRKHYVVWLPADYAQSARRYPVAYYLHGLYGNEWNWVKAGGLATTMDSLVAAGMPPMIVVMPDGDDSWWTTWNQLWTLADCRRTPPQTGESVEDYCVPWPHYDDYVARDLVADVDSAFRTEPSRARRAVAGLSMGGLGAMSLALAYPDVFAAAASHSGVVSPLYDGPSPFAEPPRYASTEERLREKWRRFWPSMGPAFGRDTTGWWARDPARLARRLQARGGPMPALYLDAGVDDQLTIDENRAFDAELRTLGIAHEYVERPGAHDWKYWSANAPRSLQWIAGIVGK